MTDNRANSRAYRQRHRGRVKEQIQRRKPLFAAYLRTPIGKAAHKAGAMNTRARSLNASGRLSANDLLPLYQSDSCARCGRQDTVEIDHCIPLSLGGTNTADNLIVLCADCHKLKTQSERQAKAYGTTLPQWIYDLRKTEPEQLSLF